MSTAILYYSEHHGNTKMLLDEIAGKHEVTLIDVTKEKSADLSGYDCIGLASGIYFGNYAKPFLAYAQEHLPENKQVFFIYTHGAKGGNFLKAIREITEAKHCTELGEYRCRGYDTFGPFKIVGGIAKGHPTDDEKKGAVSFYESLIAKQ